MCMCIIVPVDLDPSRLVQGLIVPPVGDKNAGACILGAATREVPLEVCKGRFAPWST